MELKLDGGRYMSQNGALAEVEGDEELLQRIAMRLTARRGGFAPMPDYGSRLWTLMRTAEPGMRESAARAYIAEALREEPGLRVESVAYSEADGAANIALRLAREGGTLELALTYKQGGT